MSGYHDVEYHCKHEILKENLVILMCVRMWNMQCRWHVCELHPLCKSMGWGFMLCLIGAFCYSRTLNRTTEPNGRELLLRKVCYSNMQTTTCRDVNHKDFKVRNLHGVSLVVVRRHTCKHMLQPHLCCMCMWMYQGTNVVAMGTYIFLVHVNPVVTKEIHRRRVMLRG